jgi:DNA mismatch repair ATPase MutS
MLAHVEALRVESPVLRALQARLAASGARATVEVERLRRIVGFLDARQNEVWRLFVGPVLLWDLNCVIALEAWRTRVGGSVRAWFDVLGEWEALASLAGFAFERPDHAYPDLDESPRFEAIALGHPLIAASKRVANDVALHGRGEALVVTGSNMSGKSTLLRAIGINAVLALAGAPVCARKLAFGPLDVVTSMRVRDSLEEGVSRFYAEVRKLKRVIERARSGRPTLFLLDEILHGTNSRERLIGARAIVRELLARGACGAVSTHDLALGDLEEAHAGKVKNVHFEEQVSGDTMTFDYKLRTGVVKSSNALRIMRMVGIDVVEPEKSE